MFDMVVLRFTASIGHEFTKRQFFNSYLANIDPVEFVERTWSKPRDFIRFFKCASKLYPSKTSLSPSEANAVWRNYAQEAWKEMKSAASPFLTPGALTSFEHVLAKLAPNIFDGSIKLDVKTFAEYLKPVYLKAKGNHSNFYTFDHFLHLLYILGIFLTRRRDEYNQDIFYSYHRGTAIIMQMVKSRSIRRCLRRLDEATCREKTPGLHGATARRHESSETQARRAAGWWTGRTKHSMIVEAIIATIAAEREARPAGAQPF